MPGPVKKVRGKMMYHRGKGEWAEYSPGADRQKGRQHAKHPSKPGYPHIGDRKSGRRRPRGIFHKMYK